MYKNETLQVQISYYKERNLNISATAVNNPKKQNFLEIIKNSCHFHYKKYG